MTRDLGIKFDSPPKWVPFNDPSWAKRSVLNKKTRGERVKSSEAKKKKKEITDSSTPLDLSLEHLSFSLNQPKGVIILPTPNYTRFFVEMGPKKITI